MMDIKPGSKKWLLLALTAIVASMGVGASVFAETGKGKPDGKGNGGPRVEAGGEAEMDAEIEIGAEGEAEGEAADEAGAAAKARAGARVETGARVENGAKIETGARVETGAGADAEIRADSGAEAEAEAETGDESKAGAGEKSKADGRGAAETGNGENRGQAQSPENGLENALSNLKKTSKPSADAIQDILADGTVNAETLALVLEAAGQFEAAAAAQQEAARADPTNPKLVKKLAKLLEKAGHRDMKAFVNGVQPDFDVPPFVKNGRMMVPFRAVAAALKADVSYDVATRTVTVARGDFAAKLTLGSDTAYVNGVAVKLDVAAESENGRTVVPLRFLGEALGAKVDFDAETQSVIMTEQTAAE